MINRKLKCKHRSKSLVLKPHTSFLSSLFTDSCNSEEAWSIIWRIVIVFLDRHELKENVYFVDFKGDYFSRYDTR